MGRFAGGSDPLSLATGGAGSKRSEGGAPPSASPAPGPSKRATRPNVSLGLRTLSYGHGPGDAKPDGADQAVQPRGRRPAAVGGVPGRGRPHGPRPRRLAGRQV